MNRTQLASLILGALLAGLGAIIAAPDGSLGLNAVVLNWCGVAVAVLAFVQAALQSETVQATVGLRRSKA